MRYFQGYIALALGSAFFLFEQYTSLPIESIYLVLILIFGIPHGAIDHKLHLTLTDGKSVLIYILRYLGIMAIYAVLWYFFPLLSLIFFILLSGYHFGQESLEDLKIKHSSTHIFLWGGLILVAPTIFNYEDIKPFLEVISRQNLPDIDLMWRRISAILIAALAIFYAVKSGITQMILLASVIVLAYGFISFLGAFTIYFLVFHSYNAFKHQFLWFRDHLPNYSLKKFIVDLMPFSFLAVFGLAFLFWLVKPTDMELVIGYFFIFASLLTLPHAITFDSFYRSVV